MRLVEMSDLGLESSRLQQGRPSELSSQVPAEHRVLCFCCGLQWQGGPEFRARCCCKELQSSFGHGNEPSVLVQSEEHISFDLRLHNYNSVQVCTDETTWHLLPPDGFPQRFQCYLEAWQCFCAAGCLMALGSHNAGCAS